MIRYRYIFRFDDNTEKTFEVHIDSETLNIRTETGTTSEWTLLDFCKCGVCSLEASQTAFCPVAVNISGLVRAFRDIISYLIADVTVETEERTVSKRVPVQNGLFSLLGIYMAASGCPAMDKLKPMVRHHLPFATIEETVYRAMTMYLAAQYFRMKKGLPPDWELNRLYELYDTVKKVNMSFSQRIREAAREDAMINSLAHLDLFATSMQTVSLKKIGSLESLFGPYLKEG